MTLVAIDLLIYYLVLISIDSLDTVILNQHTIWFNAINSISTDDIPSVMGVGYKYTFNTTATEVETEKNEQSAPREFLVRM